MVKNKQAVLVQPVTDPRLQERYRRRIQSPESLAPKLRARQLHLLTWAISIRKLSSNTRDLNEALFH